MSDTPVSTPTSTARPAVPRSVFHAAWVLPVLILSEFALVGLIPVVLIAVGVTRRVRDLKIRILAALVTVAYAVPFLLWALDPDRAESLSKSMSPVFATLIALSSSVLAVVAFRSRKH